MGDYCAKIPVVCKERKIDEELLYQLLLELLTDDELSVKMANLVRTKYEESFSISLYTTKMMALYKSFFLINLIITLNVLVSECLCMKWGNTFLNNRIAYSEKC